MEELIREIYIGGMQNTKYNQIDKEIEQEIQSLLKKEKEYMQPMEYEQYRDRMYQAAFFAKEKGFIEGFRYGIKLSAECFIRKEDFVKP